MMYQAKRGHAPLVVIAGESGIRYDAMDAQMAADLVSMARPVTKWATRVVDPRSLLRVLRRAIKIAATPPMGPVFVALPMDVLDALQRGASCRRRSPTRGSRPAPRRSSAAAALLAGADRPIMIMGDGVAFSGAQAELTRVAELLGAEVWGANSSEVNMTADHPLFRGQLGHMFGEHSRAITTQADAVLIVGTYVFPEVFPALEGVFARRRAGRPRRPRRLRDRQELPGRPRPRRRPEARRSALLADALERTLSAEQREAARRRDRPSSARRSARSSTRTRRADAQFDGDTPLHPSTFMAELARQVPDDVDHLRRGADRPRRS